MCPCRLAVRGLASSALGFVPTPRLVLLVSAAYTRPLTGLTWMSSGRSILVGAYAGPWAPSSSAASRVKVSTQSTFRFGTIDLPSFTSADPPAGAVELSRRPRCVKDPGAGDLGRRRVAVNCAT